MGRTPAEIRDEVTLAGRILTDALEELRRRRWLLPLALALAVGVLLRRRPVSEIAKGTPGAVDRTLQIAGALAAIERYRRSRRAA